MVTINYQYYHWATWICIMVTKLGYEQKFFDDVLLYLGSAHSPTAHTINKIATITTWSCLFS